MERKCRYYSDGVKRCCHTSIFGCTRSSEKINNLVRSIEQYRMTGTLNMDIDQYGYMHRRREQDYEMGGNYLSMPSSGFARELEMCDGTRMYSHCPFAEPVNPNEVIKYVAVSDPVSPLMAHKKSTERTNKNKAIKLMKIRRRHGKNL